MSRKYNGKSHKHGAVACVASTIAIVAFLGGGNAWAADDNAEEVAHLPAGLESTSAWSWLETNRDRVSRNVTNLGRNLDDWLAGDGVGERSNESYLRLKLNQQFSDTGAYYSNVRLSGRIDLPRATERWKLIFESEQTELDSISEQRLNNIRPSSF